MRRQVPKLVPANSSSVYQTLPLQIIPNVSDLLQFDHILETSELGCNVHFQPQVNIIYFYLLTHQFYPLVYGSLALLSHVLFLLLSLYTVSILQAICLKILSYSEMTISNWTSPNPRPA